MKQLKIGNIKFKNRLFLAPMVEITDLAFRLVCRKQGAAMAYTEMLYVDSILHENKKTMDFMKTIKEDKPLGIQITGNSINEFEKIIPFLKPYNLVDINCGCPSMKITGSKAGSYLLNNPEKIKKIIEILKKSEKPVTAKIRLGFKKNNVLKVAKTIEKAGADALTLHPRLATQGSSIPADWSWIKKIKSNVGIPVIGNGDVFTGQDAAKMLDIADGVMIARAAWADPSIFSRILKYLKTGKEKEVDPKKRIEILKNYLSLSEKYNLIEMPRIKYVGCKFLRNFNGSAKKRNEFMHLKDLKEMKKFIKNIA